MEVWLLALTLAVPRPCLPDELGRIQHAVEAPPPPPAPAPPPAPPPLPVPLTRLEHAQYRIGYGLLGNLGDIDLSLAPGNTGAEAVKLVGSGHGSLLGLGQTEKRIESVVDPRSLGAQRWTSFRSSGGKTVTDFAQQAEPGKVAIVRRRPGKPDRPDVLKRAAPVLDPLTFLLRLRVTPPTTPESFEVLDGQGLWVITVQPPEVVAEGTGRALRLNGRAAPIYWDGSPDDERTVHTFSLWLTNDAFRTPLRLVMPMGPGEVRAELVALWRTKKRPQALLRGLLQGSLARWLDAFRRPQ
jgi:Protein of unknown function (DUF3108)